MTGQHHHHRLKIVLRALPPPQLVSTFNLFLVKFLHKIAIILCADLIRCKTIAVKETIMPIHDSSLADLKKKIKIDYLNQTSDFLICSNNIFLGDGIFDKVLGVGVGRVISIIAFVGTHPPPTPKGRSGQMFTNNETENMNTRDQGKWV